MEIVSPKENSEEREEGEIVEDELEQVSDCPMTPCSPQNSGKSVSSPELLSSVCLSSISSREYSRPPRYTRKRSNRTNGRCKCSVNRKRHNSNYVAKRKWKRRKSCSDLKYNNKSSESDDDIVNPKYVRQLRDALKHESNQELQRSLRSRLKGFIGLGSPSDEDEDDSNLAILRNIALNSSKNVTNGETIKSIETCGNKESNKDENHENIDDNELEQLRIAALKSFIIKNHERRKRKAEILNGNTEIKNDSNELNKENDKSVINNDNDLNSNKKIKADLEKEENNVNLKDENQEDKSKNFGEEDADILRAMLLASISKSLASESTTKEKLQTETFLKKTKTSVNYLKSNTRTVKNDLYNNQQKINPRVVVKPLIINVNGDSDSDTETLKETVTEFLKKQRAEVEANTKEKSEFQDLDINKSDDLLMEKSAMRLLPRSQQIEYRKLKQQLINARKKTRLRKVSQRISETSQIKKVPKLKINTSSNISIPEKKNGESAGNFQKTLNELRIRKNGRLQMKGKYQSLAMLLHKINQASIERREHELEIKKLLQEIQKAKSKLAVSHKRFTTLVQQLVKEKQNIDERSLKLTRQPYQQLFTSTPNKVINNIQSNQNETKEINVQDTKEKEPVTFLKYTSPLDNSSNILRNELKDPLTTVCPYDLLGVCKDKDCQYKHCL